MKRNVTITLDEETARWVRVEAAKRDESVSAYVGHLLRRERERDEGYVVARDLFLSREARPLGKAGVPYPTREALHTRP